MELDNLLNKEQLLPVYQTEGPVLVLAGAGSGKTRVLTYRIANLIANHNVNPFNILAITFTNKAANEMKERITKVTGSSGILISTFHSLCVRILRQEIEVIGEYTKNFTIYDAADQESLIKKIIKSREDYEDIKKLVGLFAAHISRAKNKGMSPEGYAKDISLLSNKDIIIQIYKQYEEEKKRNNALDFDDLLLLTVTIFHQNKDILEKYRERFKYIHVDEFQDTNTVQYLLVRLLASKYRNVFVVGDDDQSIYGWRGADYTNIKKFREHFPECQIYKLEQNYRSTKNILDFANKVISYNTERMDKKLWTEGSQGVRIEYRQCFNERDEADYVIGQIKSLQDRYDYSLKDFAVLFRTTTISRPFEEKLALYAIPYKIIGGHKFYERKEIKDVLAYLNSIVNPKDNTSIMRIINIPARGIGEVVQEKFQIACKEKNMSLVEGLKNLDSLNLTPQNKKKLAVFKELYEDLESHQNVDIYSYVKYVCKMVNFEKMYDENDDEDAQRLENLEDFILSVNQFAKDNKNATLSEYLQSVALITDDDSEDDRNILTLATVHGVKGLEYRCVFIVGLEDGLFPSKREDTTLKEIEEERRVMYVAITRAKERLYLTNTSTRFRFGTLISNTPSQFLLEGEIIKPKARFNIDEEDIFADFGDMFNSKPNNSSKKSAKSNGIDLINVMKKTPSFAQSVQRSNVNDKDLSKFVAGKKVKHTKFGEGIILNVSGENADIKFETLGVKKFNIRLAPIEVID